MRPGLNAQALLHEVVGNEGCPTAKQAQAHGISDFTSRAFLSMEPGSCAGLSCVFCHTLTHTQSFGGVSSCCLVMLAGHRGYYGRVRVVESNIRACEM